VLLVDRDAVVAAFGQRLTSALMQSLISPDVQVIVITDYPGQAPQVIEDQVTYPLTTALMGVPHTKAVRGRACSRRR